MNTFIGVGNLGKAPEMTQTQSGLAITKFSIATQDSRKKGDEWINETDWHNVTVFGKTAENAEKYLRKGSKVAVHGKIKTDSWEKDGKKNYRTYVLADKLEFLDPKGHSFEKPAACEDNLSDVDIPF